MRCSRMLSSVLALGTSLYAGVAVTVQPDKIAHALNPAGLNGTVLPIWYSPERVHSLAEGLRRGGFSVFRYPNGTLSNEYHWNGSGTYDSVGIWHASDSTFTPGFKVNTRYRGTTRNNYGSLFPSMIVDNDTATFWWGIPEQDSLEPWLMLNLATSAKVDSIEIIWGNLLPDSVKLQVLTQGDPQWSNDAVWANPLGIAVNGSSSNIKLSQAQEGTWFKVRFPGKSGVQVRELRLFASGVLVSGNAANPTTQVLAMGTHPGNDPTTETRSAWDFVTFMNGIHREFPGSEPLLCVNVGTGSPQEAAAWVHFANKVQGYGVHRWHVGNEIDGNWEQGGPLDPAQYAARFIAFTKAMKAEDSTIEVYGPVLSSMDFLNRPGGRDAEAWMVSFLRRVGEAERADGKRYLDGVDFHAYPYYIASGNGTAKNMLLAMDKLGEQLDTLGALMGRYLSQPETRKVAMTEFNASVSITYLLMHEVNGIGMADMLAQMASRFGDRALTCLWEPEGGEPMNPDGTTGSSYGSLRIFTPNRKGLATDMGDAPTSAFWGQFLVTQAWIDRGRDGHGNPQSIPLDLAGNQNARAFALTDSGRTSVLVLNLGASADSVSFSGAVVDSGEVLSWSASNYNWIGTDVDARALPNIGPTASVWKGQKVFLPAYGALVLRTNPVHSTGSKVEMLLRTVSNNKLTVGDTLMVTASLRQQGGVISRGMVYNGECLPVDSIGSPCGSPAFDTLKSLDGTWDGSHEGMVYRIAATRLKLGNNLLVFYYRGLGSILFDTVRVSVSDVPRPTTWIDRFDKPLKASELPGSPRWLTYIANGTENGTFKSSQPQWPDTTTNKRWYQVDFNLDQPAALTYPNYVATYLLIPRPWLDTTATKWVGLSFNWFTALDSLASTFEFHIAEDSVKDYDDHITKLAGTKGQWVRKTLLWSDFTQSGWGKDVGPLNFATALRLEFRAAGKGRGNFRLDNLALLSTSGDSLPLAVGVRTRPTLQAGWTLLRQGHKLSVASPDGSLGQARLFDLSGRLYTQVRGTGELRLDLPRSGLYLLELQSSGKREIHSITMVP